MKQIFVILLMGMVLVLLFGLACDDDKDLAQEYYDKGAKLLIEGQPEDAINAFDRAIQIYPQYFEAWGNKGAALLDLGNHEEALKALNKAIEIHPTYADAWCNKGSALLRSGNLKEAINAYDRSIELVPDRADYWYNKGSALDNLKDYDGEIKCFNKAIDLDPKNNHYWYSRSEIYAYEKKDKKKALRDLAKAIELEPANKEKARKSNSFCFLWQDGDFKELTGDVTQVDTTLRAIENPNYPEAKVLDESPVFCWDFSQSKVITYTYEKNTSTNMIIGLNSEKSNQSNSLYGLLLIKSTGDNMADMVMTDLKMSMPTVFYDNGKTENKEITVPPIVFHGMKEDGEVNLGRQDPMLKFLFPLPNKSLKKGESVKMPNQYPSFAMGFPFELTGYSVITLTGYVTIGKRICAEFDVLTDMSEFKMPPQLEGILECSMRGKALSYFDIKERCFVKSINSIIVRQKFDGQMPKINLPNLPGNMPENAQSSTIMNVQMRVLFKDDKTGD